MCNRVTAEERVGAGGIAFAGGVDVVIVGVDEEDCVVGIWHLEKNC